MVRHEVLRFPEEFCELTDPTVAECQLTKQLPAKWIGYQLEELERRDFDCCRHVEIVSNEIDVFKRPRGGLFKLARRKDLIRFNPTEDVERPAAKPNTVRPPSAKAIWAAIEMAMERGEPDRAAIIRLQAATGMRRGEVAGLRWEDVDLDSDPPQLTIERAIADGRGNGNGPPVREVKSTKTETGIPVVLGTGKRLFSEGAVPAGLRLADFTTSSTGVVIGTYEPAGAID